MPSDDRDEPSFVTNVERTIDLEDRSEVGTLPRPPKLFAEDEEERVEKTLLLATSEPAPVVVHRPPMHSEVAGQWLAPVPPPGLVPPITSDTAAFARTELVAPQPHLPTPPPYLPTPAPLPAPRPRGPGVFVFLGAMRVVGLAVGGLVAWKLDVLPHAHRTAPTTSAPPAPTPSAAPEPPPVAPSTTTTEAPSAAPSASAPPAPSGKHPRRRPRKGH